MYDVKKKQHLIPICIIFTLAILLIPVNNSFAHEAKTQSLFADIVPSLCLVTADGQVIFVGLNDVEYTGISFVYDEFGKWHPYPNFLHDYITDNQQRR